MCTYIQNLQVKDVSNQSQKLETFELPLSANQMTEIGLYFYDFFPPVLRAQEKSSGDFIT